MNLGELIWKYEGKRDYADDAIAQCSSGSRARDSWTGKWQAYKEIVHDLKLLYGELMQDRLGDSDFQAGDVVEILDPSPFGGMRGTVQFAPEEDDTAVVEVHIMEKGSPHIAIRHLKKVR